MFGLITLPLVINYASLGVAKKLKSSVLVRSVRTILTGGRHAQTLPVPVGPVHLNSGASWIREGTRCAYICEFSIN